MSEITQRREILFLYDVENNNPNGDPNDENKPRIDEENGRNLVTDVRLKRTIRDYLKDYKNQNIFVQEIVFEDGTIQDGKTRAKDFGKTKKRFLKMSWNHVLMCAFSVPPFPWIKIVLL